MESRLQNQGWSKGRDARAAASALSALQPEAPVSDPAELWTLDLGHWTRPGSRHPSHPPGAVFRKFSLIESIKPMMCSHLCPKGAITAQVKTYITNWDRGEQGGKSPAAKSRLAEVRSRMSNICHRPPYSALRPLSCKRPVYNSNNSNNHFLIFKTVSMIAMISAIFKKNSTVPKVPMVPTIFIFSRSPPSRRITAETDRPLVTRHPPLVTRRNSTIFAYVRLFPTIFSPSGGKGPSRRRRITRPLPVRAWPLVLLWSLDVGAWTLVSPGYPSLPPFASVQSHPETGGNSQF